MKAHIVTMNPIVGVRFSQTSLKMGLYLGICYQRQLLVGYICNLPQG